MGVGGSRGGKVTLSPMALVALSSLISKIERKELPAGRPLPSERELVDEFGVSRIVIRQALRELVERGYIHQKHRCRPIVAIPPKSSMSASSSIEPKYIATWLWPNSGEFAASKILQGIQSVVSGSNLRLCVDHAVGQDWESRFESEDRFLRSMASDPHVAGAIVWYIGRDRNLPALQAVRDAGLPLVLVDRTAPAGFDTDYVGSDNQRAACQIVRHLIGLGHTRIAILTNVDTVSTVIAREAGYRQALSESGIHICPEMMSRLDRDEDAAMDVAVESLLGLSNPPTAIFAVNDLMALQAYDFLNRRGVQIPRQLSVAGFDGLLRWVPGGGHLTSACQDFERIGQVAAELIIDRLENGDRRTCRHVLLDAPLMDRGSSGPVSAGADSNEAFPLSEVRNYGIEY